ncbi:ATP-binding protein [Streptomyces sp. CAU 1734]|uniref:ATP-binding protein n=1 Tax=Streptomyces sp. CAU 1734 TaxID=3140360 RepID=UPI0032600D89
MPVTALPPHARTRRHLGLLAAGAPGTVIGFEVSLTRSGRAGDSPTEQERSWPCRMRRLARLRLRHWGVEELAETVDVLISELVTNAVRHGHGRTVTTRLTRTATYLCVEVVTGAGDPGCRPRARVAGPDDEGGRGLFLVNALADVWGVGADGSTTWCVLAVVPGGDR